MSNKLWLRCKVTCGQFSNEVSVSGETFEGEGFSLFAPSSTVAPDQIPETSEIDGWIRVHELDREAGLVLVSLPGRTLENGSSITVSASELEREPSHSSAL